LYTVYRHLNKEGEVIYVGQSINIKSRQLNHKKSSSWFDEVEKIEYMKFDSKLDMDCSEMFLINKYKPINNKTHNRGDESKVVTVEECWKEFKISDLNPSDISSAIYVDVIEKFVIENVEYGLMFELNEKRSINGGIEDKYLNVLNDVIIVKNRKKTLYNFQMLRNSSYKSVILYKPLGLDGEGRYLFECLYDDSFKHKIKEQILNPKRYFNRNTKKFYDAVIVNKFI